MIPFLILRVPILTENKDTEVKQSFLKPQNRDFCGLCHSFDCFKSFAHKLDLIRLQLNLMEHKALAINISE